MTADEIAQLLVRQYPRGAWLTVKQTRWLYDAYVREELERTGRVQTGYAAGVVTVGDEQRVWTMRVSPINGAGSFKIVEKLTPDMLSALQSGDAHPACDPDMYETYLQRAWRCERAAYNPKLLDDEIEELAHQAEYWYTRASIAWEKRHEIR